MPCVPLFCSRSPPPPLPSACFCSFVVVVAVLIIIIPFISDCHCHALKPLKNGVRIIQPRTHTHHTFIICIYYILVSGCVHVKREYKFKYILLNARHTLVVALAHRPHTQ